ncbi:N-acetyltransferase esco2, partial [Quaeritorhiza haematococci]
MFTKVKIQYRRRSAATGTTNASPDVANNVPSSTSSATVPGLSGQSREPSTRLCTSDSYEASKENEGDGNAGSYGSQHHRQKAEGATERTMRGGSADEKDEDIRMDENATESDASESDASYPSGGGLKRTSSGSMVMGDKTNNESTVDEKACTGSQKSALPTSIPKTATTTITSFFSSSSTTPSTHRNITSKSVQPPKSKPHTKKSSSASSASTSTSTPDLQNSSSSRPSSSRSANGSKGKKQTFQQMYLDFGQKDIGLRTCRKCGMKYTPGKATDEEVHERFCKAVTGGLEYPQYKQEQVVQQFAEDGSRIVLVTSKSSRVEIKKASEIVQFIDQELGAVPSSPLTDLTSTTTKIFIHVSGSNKVLGCVVAEKISEAFQRVRNTPDSASSSPSSGSDVGGGSPGIVASRAALAKKDKCDGKRQMLLGKGVDAAEVRKKGNNGRDAGDVDNAAVGGRNQVASGVKVDESQGESRKMRKMSQVPVPSQIFA